ncbi:MAG: 23S rRNA (uracil(1939)-C(5))-methyltransferase RlmD [Ruminococcus sp.]|nr:23S rRNA (uracil(1939)-C(5))-methyltransferase RlmD [Ruminococcus sp.]
MLEKNQQFIAEIIDVTADGNGVCKIDNMAVFVPKTTIGDKIELKIVKVLKNYAFGIAEKIILPSPDRIKTDCANSEKCGGCVFRHISYEAECRIKDNIVRNAFKRIGGLEIEFEDFMACDETSRYRNKAQYPLATVNGRAVCGFFAPRSHRIIPVTDCKLQPQIFSEIVSCILDYINEKKISIYSEETHTGIMRHIYLRKGTHSGEIMVCFVVRKEISRQLNALCRILTDKFSDIKSIVMNINPEKTNVILGDKCVTLYGKETISDTMCGNEIDISPLSFYQVNTIQAEKLYAKALEYANPRKSDIIADLYCGAGTIGLSLAKYVSKIIGIEIIPQAIENARKNALQNNITNAEFYCGDAGNIFSELRQNGCKADIIIIDPPRKGCSVHTLETIIQAAPEKIIMISCNPATAARDVEWLSKRGYFPSKACGVDLFPRTGHCEVCICLEKE